MTPLRLLPLSALPFVLLLAVPAFAGEAEDAEYQALVTAAMADPKAADYGRMRTVYAQSSYYHGADTDPMALLVEKKFNEPASQDLKDRMAAQLKADFAMPLVHPTYMTIMGWNVDSPQAAMNVAAYRGLIDAIVASGDGESAATARTILHRGEGETVLENMGVLGNDWRMREVEEGGRKYYVYTVTNESWTAWWSGSRYDIWFDTTAFSRT